MIQVNRERYEIVEEKREGFNEEAFIGRFSDVLEKYDYIVGDWGHGQLRLRGFYEDNHEKATFDTKISHVADYLYEYCNFGCAYFIVKRMEFVEGEEAPPRFDGSSANTLKLKRKFSATKEETQDEQ